MAELGISTELDQLCRQTIREGSKSFSFAGRLLPAVERQSAFLLYKWCRHCDDQIDEAPMVEVPSRLSELKKMTALALESDVPVTNPSFRALQLIAKKFKIPQHYPQQLIAGMAMDANFRQPQTMQELEQYCYRVAGVVGLMMSHIMGVRREQAMQAACAMGIGMQLTNICRDIGDDFEMGRVYLPADLLRRHGVQVEQLMDKDQRPKLVACVDELLDRANHWYRKGDQGLVDLSWPCAWAISSAREIYSAIGDEVRKAGQQAWDYRQRTSTWQKVVKTLRALKKVGRPRFRHRPAALNRVWTFEACLNLPS